MKKAIRLTVALVAALAFTTAWAADDKDEQCGDKDKPCATEVAQDGSADDAMMAAGSGAGEPYGSDNENADELYKQRWKHEIWESGD